MTVGENIQKLRKEKGYTQKSLAQMAGVATGTIQQYELGKRQPRLEQLKKIASVFQIYVGELLGDNYTDYKEEIISDSFSSLKKSLDNSTINNSGVEYIDIYLEEMNEYFNLLNETGKKKAIEHTEMLTKIKEFIEK